MAVIAGGRVIEGSIPRDAARGTIVASAAPGNVTVTGVKPRDTLVKVLYVDFSDTNEVGSDVTGEFTISAVDTINNTGGSTATGGFLIVSWLSVA